MGRFYFYLFAGEWCLLKRRAFKDLLLLLMLLLVANLRYAPGPGFSLSTWKIDLSTSDWDQWPCGGFMKGILGWWKERLSYLTGSALYTVELKGIFSHEDDFDYFSREFSVVPYCTLWFIGLSGRNLTAFEANIEEAPSLYSYFSSWLTLYEVGAANAWLDFINRELPLINGDPVELLFFAS